ncbi:hypothetical protein KIPB_013656, partial [Kipferlia bialata]
QCGGLPDQGINVACAAAVGSAPLTRVELSVLDTLLPEVFDSGDTAIAKKICQWLEKRVKAWVPLPEKEGERERESAQEGVMSENSPDALLPPSAPTLCTFLNRLRTHIYTHVSAPASPIPEVSGLALARRDVARAFLPILTVWPKPLPAK